MQRCLDVALDLKPNKTFSAPCLLEVCAFSPYFCEIGRTSNFPYRDKNDPILDMVLLLTNKLSTQMTITNESLSKVSHGLICSITHFLNIRDIR